MDDLTFFGKLLAVGGWIVVALGITAVFLGAGIGFDQHVSSAGHTHSTAQIVAACGGITLVWVLALAIWTWAWTIICEELS